MRAFIQPNPGDRTGSVIISGDKPLLNYLPPYAIANPGGRGVIVPLSCLDDARQLLQRGGFEVIDASSTRQPGRWEGHYHPPGEELTCPRCTPGYQRPPEILALIEQVKRDLAARVRRND